MLAATGGVDFDGLHDALPQRARREGAALERVVDSLDVELRHGKEVWVKFQNFQAGRADKVPVA